MIFIFQMFHNVNVYHLIIETYTDAETIINEILVKPNTKITSRIIKSLLGRSVRLLRNFFAIFQEN